MQFASPRELAERFVQELPRVAWAGFGPDTTYVTWFEDVLARTAPIGLIYAHGDYEEPTGEGLYAAHCPVQRVPMPPPGLAKRGAWEQFGERLSRKG